MSIVSAKAEVDGRKVALGVALEQPLAELRARLDETAPVSLNSAAKVRTLSGGGAPRRRKVREAMTGWRACLWAFWP